MYPGNAGGTNWGSVAIEPSRRVAILNMSNLPFVVRLIPRDDFEREKSAGRGLLGLREFAVQEGTPYGLLREPLQGPLLMPCVAPPWGTLRRSRSTPARSSGRCRSAPCRINCASRFPSPWACRTSAARS
jgi:glucose dehydrogenase